MSWLRRVFEYSKYSRAGARRIGYLVFSPPLHQFWRLQHLMSGCAIGVGENADSPQAYVLDVLSSIPLMFQMSLNLLTKMIKTKKFGQATTSRLHGSRVCRLRSLTEEQPGQYDKSR